MGINGDDKRRRRSILISIQEILQPWLKNSKMLSEKVNLIEDLGIDSVGILQLLLNLEQKYQIQIPEYELDAEMMSSLGKFIDFIEQKIYANN